VLHSLGKKSLASWCSCISEPFYSKHYISRHFHFTCKIFPTVDLLQSNAHNVVAALALLLSKAVLKSSWNATEQRSATFLNARTSFRHFLPIQLFLYYGVCEKMLPPGAIFELKIHQNAFAQPRTPLEAYSTPTDPVAQPWTPLEA